MTGVNVQPDGELLEPGNSNAATEPMKPVVDEQPRKDHDLNFPINDALLVGHGISSSAAPEAVSYPIVDLSEVAPALPTQAPSNAQSPTPTAPTLVPSNVVAVPTSTQGTDAKNAAAAAVEDILLKELEEMGFKQVDLNKEILRINEYNLEQSVDHLCGVSEWDPILEELQEMVSLPWKA
jgi:next-to-BRCA1 protein 1